MLELKCEHCGTSIERDNLPRDPKAHCFGWSVQIYAPCDNCKWVNVISYATPMVVTSYDPERG